MRRRVYNALVNRHAGISYRYHKIHDGAGSVKKVFSWFYLLWLNFCYYVLFMHHLGDIPESPSYEEKRLLPPGKEGIYFSVEEYVSRINSYEVVSFDIFDTLVLRPFSEPTDVFFYVGNELGIMDFKNLRMQVEAKARKLEYSRSGSYEISYDDIYDMLEQELGTVIDRNIELEAELKFCFANPFMKQVFDRLVKANKRIVITSDMYLNSGFLKKLLNNCGYENFERIFVSCEYKKNKYEGGLYREVKNYVGAASIVHIGDNKISDVEMAKAAGISSIYYPNVNLYSKKYRTYDCSSIAGGAYRGVVNNKLYCGTAQNSAEYEYGYVYGGLFVYGYCNFINRYCQQNNVEKVLFLSRDGDILKQAYDIMFGDEKTEYVYWSRKAATKLMAGHNRYDYFRRFLYHKVNSGVTIAEALKSMDIADIPIKLDEFKLSDKLTGANVEAVKQELINNYDAILRHYADEHKGASAYYGAILTGVRKAVAVDIGWAGSGAYSLDYLVNRVWNINCEITGMIAGTNTVFNAEPDCSETMLDSGRMVSYMYSQSHNRDLLKKHNPNKNYNVFWEILLSSPTRQFTGFGYDSEMKLNFGCEDYNTEGIVRLQQGILDFIRDYRKHFAGTIYENISGRDAYAPMLLASCENEKYLRSIEKLFKLEINL